MQVIEETNIKLKIITYIV